MAQYCIHVPTHDELSNRLRVHHAVHQHLLSQGHAHPTINEGYPYHQVTTWAEESPEMDSRMKQIGQQAAQVANVPRLWVSRQGKAPAHWELHNKHYVPGEGARLASFVP